MKTKRNLSVIAIFAVILFMTLSACQKDDGGDPGYGSYITASSSGSLNQENYFSDLVKFRYDGETIVLSANQPGDTVYSCTVKVGSKENPLTTIGEYKCGEGQPGNIELIVHGTKDVVYKPVSGTIKIVVLGSDVFSATFNVTLQEQNKKETIRYKGKIRY